MIYPNTQISLYISVCKKGFLDIRRGRRIYEANVPISALLEGKRVQILLVQPILLAKAFKDDIRAAGKARYDN
jgi:hypothetical protein